MSPVNGRLRPALETSDTFDMNSSAKASREYLKSAVMTASPEQLQLMLLDGAVRYAERGRKALQQHDLEGAFNGFERAQRIVLELNNGLRREVNPRLVDEMAALYDFIYRRLIDANVHREIQAVDDALLILRHQRETWALLIERLARETPPGPAGGSPADPVGSSEPGGPALSIEG